MDNEKKRVQASKDQPVLDHLAELRIRLIIIFSLIGILTAMAYWKSDLLLEWLKKPLSPRHVEFAFFTMTEAFMTRLKIALAAAIILSCPMIYYQLMAFIGPGLHEKEKRLIRGGILTVTPLFLTGAVFGIQVLAPLTLHGLYVFGSSYMVAAWSADLYIMFIGVLIVTGGVIFTMPVVLILMAKLGLVSSKKLRKSRLTLILVLLTGGGVIIGDLTAILVLAVPLLLLFEISLWFVHRMEERKIQPAEDSELDLV